MSVTRRLCRVLAFNVPCLGAWDAGLPMTATVRTLDGAEWLYIVGDDSKAVVVAMYRQEPFFATEDGLIAMPMLSMLGADA